MNVAGCPVLAVFARAGIETMLAGKFSFLLRESGCGCVSALRKKDAKDAGNDLSVEEQEALADSLISNLGSKVNEGVQAAWDEEIKHPIEELDSGKAKTIPWEEVRERNLRKLPRAH